MTRNLRGSLIGLAWFAAGPLWGGDWSLEIHHAWAEEAVQVGETEHPRSNGGSLRFERVSYLLSEPAWVLADGTTTREEGRFGWVNLGGEGTALQLPDLPRNGSIAALEFNIGLPESVDRADPHQYAADHPLNPVRNNLHWSWQGGYIFLALEGRWTGKQEESGFSYHLGNAPHLMRVRVPIDGALSGSGRLAVEFDLQRVLGDADLVSIADQTSTHGRDGDPLAMVLKTAVENAFRLLAVVEQPPQETSVAVPVPDDALVGTPFPLTVREGFPLPPLPLDYPLTRERVELGRRLFHDSLLSKDGSLSCATCHQAGDVFSDPRPLSIGVDGQLGRRHSMPLQNLAWKSSFFWDGRAPSLREQVLMPIEDPTEMGETLENVVGKLQRHPLYPSLFKAAFGERKVTEERLGIAIEQFLLTLTSMDSRFDQAARGEIELTELEKKGFDLFFTEYDPRRQQYGADCFHCHGGVFFTDHDFHNNGLGDGLGEGAVEELKRDLGLAEVSGSARDEGKFATPSLRNVGATAPYMHDGRFQTLEQVVAHYSEGVQRSPTLDPNLAKHPGSGIPLSDQDQAALVAFLRTLTDPRFLPGHERSDTSAVE